MMESSFLKELAELERRFKQFSVVGTGEVSVSGNLRTGIAVNVKRVATASTGDTGDAVGACCFEDGSCSVETGPDCIDDGGTYRGSGTSCSPNPCPVVGVGACCYDDGTCDDLIESECTDAGGNWQGSGTTCDDDPPPCELPPCDCGFDDFDGSGRKFLTRTEVWHLTNDVTCPCGVNAEDSSWTCTQHYEDDCSITESTTGSRTNTDCDGNETHPAIDCTCRGDVESATVRHVHEVVDGGCFLLTREATCTLSDECAPTGFSPPP